MSNYNIEFSLIAKQGNKTKENLNNIIKDLEKIQKLSVFELKYNEKDIKSLEDSLKNIEKTLNLKANIDNKAIKDFVKDLDKIKNVSSSVKINIDKSGFDSVATELQKLKNLSTISIKIDKTALSNFKKELKGIKLDIKINKSDLDKTLKGFKSLNNKVNFNTNLNKEDFDFILQTLKKIKTNSNIKIKIEDENIKEYRKDLAYIYRKLNFKARYDKKSFNDFIKLLKKVRKLSTIELKFKSGNLEKYEKELKEMVETGKASINSLRQEVNYLNNSILRGAKYNEKYSNTVKDLGRSIQNTNDEYDNFAKAISDTTIFAGSMLSLTSLKHELIDVIDYLADLDESVYNLGVVSNKSFTGIEKLRTDLLKMSASVPQSAKEIADAMDLIVRTGVDFDNAMKIINSGITLATASGEDLKFISQLLSKSIVAFSLNADTTADTINRFHSVVLKTPLSIQGLSDAMKNSASAFATLINFTNKTGDDLKTYKKDLLDLATALTGQFAKLGVQASKSGTLIRNLITRLMSNTNTARKAFNELGLTLEGNYLTFSKFSNLASNDVYKALDVLTSQLDKLEGNKEVLRNMFTQRQWAYMLPILQEINGNTREFVKTLTVGYDAQKGFNMQLKALNNQLKLLKNGLHNAQNALFEVTKLILSDVLPAINGLFKTVGAIDNATNGLISATAILTISITALATAFSVLKKVMEFSGISRIVTKLDPVSLSIFALSTAFASLYLHIKRSKAAALAFKDDINKLVEETEKLKEENNDLSKSIDKNIKLYNELKNMNLSKPWEDLSDQIDAVLSKSDEYKNISNIISKTNLSLVENPEFDYYTFRGLEGTIKSYEGVLDKIRELKKELKVFQKYKDTLKPDEKLNQESYLVDKLYSVGIKWDASLEGKDYDKLLNQINLKEKEIYKTKEKYQNDYNKLINDYYKLQIKNREKLNENLLSMDKLLYKSKIETLESAAKIDNKYLNQLIDLYGNTFDKIKEITGKKLDFKSNLDLLKNSEVRKLVDDFVVKKGIVEAFEKSLLENLFTETNISTEDLAKALGIDEKTLSKLETKSEIQKWIYDNITNIDYKTVETSFDGVLNKITDEDKKKALNSIILRFKTALDNLRLSGVVLQGTIENTNNKTKEFEKTLKRIEKIDFSDKINEFKLIDLEGVDKDLAKLDQFKKKLESLGNYNIDTFSKSYDEKFNKLKDFIDKNKKYIKYNEDGTYTITNKEIYEQYKQYLYDLGIEEKNASKIIDLLIKKKSLIVDIRKQYSGQITDNKKLIEDVRKTIETIDNMGKSDEAIKKEKLATINKKLLDLKTNKLSAYGIGTDQSKIEDVYKQVKGEILRLEEGLQLRKENIVNLSDDELKKEKTIIEENKKKIQTLSEFINLYENLLNLQKKEIEGYKKQYEFLNVLKSNSSNISNVLGFDVGSVVDLADSLFSKEGDLAKYKKAKKELEKNPKNFDAMSDQYSAMAGMALKVINVFDTVYDGILQKEIDAINLRMKTLDMQKQLAKTDEERAKIDKQMLNAQKKVIDLQMEQQANAMVLNSIASGAQLGASIGGVWGAGIGAGLGLLSGLFGQEDAKIQAHNQKEMLEAQFTTNKILEEQTKLQRTLVKLTENANNYGIKQAKQLFEFLSTTGMGEASWRKSKYFGLKHKTVNETETYTISGADTFEEYLANVEAAKKRQALISSLLKYEKEGTKIKELSNYSDLEKIYKEITGSDVVVGHAGNIVFSGKNEAKLKAELEAVSNAVEQAKENIDEYKEALEEVQATWQGFEKVKLESGKEKWVWTTRMEILNKSIENAKSGANELGKLISGKLNDALLNFLTKSEDSPLEKSMTKLEELFSKVGNYLKDKKYGKTIKHIVGENGKEMMSAVSLFKEVVSETENLKKVQDDINKKQLKFINLWSMAGGKISDIQDKLVDGLYPAMQDVFKSETYEDGIDALSDYLFEKLSAQRIKEVMDDTFSSIGVSLNNAIYEAINTNQSISDIIKLRTQFEKYAIMAENERRNIQMLEDILSYNREVEYKANNNEITYETGTTKNIINNNYNTIQVSFNDSIGFSEDSGYAIANALIPYLEQIQGKR